MICINCRHRWHEGCSSKDASKTWCDCQHRPAPKSAIYDEPEFTNPMDEFIPTVVPAEMFDELMKDQMTYGQTTSLSYTNEL